MAKLSETTARTTIAMMRSIASHKPITPFHLMAADQMEKLLNEVLEYRKGAKPKKWVGLKKVERTELWHSINWDGWPEHSYGKAIEEELKRRNT
jgi:hypothetical protein